MDRIILKIGIYAFNNDECDYIYQEVVKHKPKLEMLFEGTDKWFYHKHDLRGRRESVPLGEFPAVSLAQARQMATVNEASIYTEGHALLDSKKGITFGQFIEGEIYQKAGRKRASHYEIMDNLRAVVPKKIHNLQINHITPTDIEGFIDDRLKEGKKKGTINKNLTNIRSVFKVAFNSGLVDENIMKKVPSLTDDTATEKLALTEDERVRLIRTAEDMSLPQSWKRKHLPIFIHLGLDAGLRKMECLKLRWTDICNDSIKTIDVDIQNIKYQFQTPNVVIAEHKKDGSILDEKQLIRLYDASERTLTVLRLYPSIDQTKKDHKSISDLEKRLEKDGYRLSLDTRRNWYVKVPADKAKSRKSRSIGIRYETMQMIFKYMKELYKDDLNKEAKEGYMFDSLMVYFQIYEFESIIKFGTLPIWMIILWLSFSILFDEILIFLKNYKILGIILSGILGPLTYYLGEPIGVLSIYYLHIFIILMIVFWMILMFYYLNFVIKIN